MFKLCVVLLLLSGCSNVSSIEDNTIPVLATQSVDDKSFKIVGLFFTFIILCAETPVSLSPK